MKSGLRQWVIQSFVKPDGGSAPSMIRDSIENAGLGDGVTPDASEAWMIELKNAAATGFLGVSFAPL